MPSESLSVRFSGINSASNAQVVILYLLGDKIELHRPICRLCCLFFSYDLRLRYTSKSQFLQLGHIRAQVKTSTNQNVYNQNVYKPKRLQPKRLQPKRLQTITSTNYNAYKPKRLKIESSTSYCMFIQ